MPVVDRFCQYVLQDWAGKGFLLLAAALLVTRLLHRSAAATRHLVWLLTFAGLLLLPLLSAWRRAGGCCPTGAASKRPRSRWRQSTPEWLPQPDAGPNAVDDDPAVWSAAAEAEPALPAINVERFPAAASPRASAGKRLTWHFWIAAIWAGGVAVMLLRLLLGSFRLRRLGRIGPAGR